LTPCFSFILQGIKGLWEEEYSDRLLVTLQGSLSRKKEVEAATPLISKRLADAQ
jgi:hypothetical protein